MEAVDMWEIHSVSLGLNHAELRGWSRLSIMVSIISADIIRCGCISE